MNGTDTASEKDMELNVIFKPVACGGDSLRGLHPLHILAGITQAAGLSIKDNQ